MNDDNITLVSHYGSLWGAVANIFITAEKRYAHVNGEICQRYGLQRKDNAIQADSYMIAIAHAQTDKTNHGPRSHANCLNKNERCGGKNVN